ncbi:LLM class flavin-dependent oxidoreductase [Paenibacillus herberti]|uniref:Luciferase-like domain-containing protein n=1 Tax=Paenibacillus herberti TaxID=1619309 RepID=A0A229NVL3_9BACL|nr:LLM class flavin-dependent oxidoreductase [Paenibacillus herberti]OXM13898.1 hypothetical protein CGZ75_12860 [Paenibacillus herberti]
MEFCWALPVSDVNECRKQAVDAEKYGFDGVLVASAKQALDPWILTMMMCQDTSRVRFLVAQNTNMLLPHITLKNLTSIHYLMGDRFDLNIVTGGIKQESLTGGDFPSHEHRYKRTNEFVKCMRLLMQGTTNFNGMNFSYSDLEVQPQFEGQSRLFIAGSSSAASEVALSAGDVMICYADTTLHLKNRIKQLKHEAALRNRTLKIGIYIDILAKAAQDEAIEIAYQKHEQFSGFHKKITKMYLNEVDSVGIRNNKHFKDQHDLWVEEHLWAGLSEVSRSVGLTVVGSFKQVSDKLGQYRDIGVDYFLVSGYLDESACETMGRHIIPCFK